MIPAKDLQKLMRDEDAEMLAGVKAYDAAKARLRSKDGEDELIPLQITERRLSGEPALRIRVCLQAYRKPQKMVPALAAAGSGETLIRASFWEGHGFSRAAQGQ